MDYYWVNVNGGYKDNVLDYFVFEVVVFYGSFFIFDYYGVVSKVLDVG